MTDKPAFDPSKPFDVVKPDFDPSQPFQAADDTGSSLGGVAKSLGVGAAEGAIGLAGLPGDSSNLLAKGSKAASDYIAGKLGFGPSPDVAPPILPTSAGIQKGVEGVTGDFYKPQGTAEEIAQKAGQFLPAMVGGPEGLATKALTRVAAPAVASQVGGDVGGPIGSAVGALAGGAGASAGLQKFSALLDARKAAEAMPSALETKAASKLLYQDPDVAAVKINPSVTSDLADTISSDLQHGPNSGFRPANEAPVFNAVDELKNAASEGRPANVADLDNVRQVLGGLAKEKDPIGQATRQAAAASRAIGHIDNFLPNLQQPDLLAGDAAAANAKLQDARANWSAYKKSSQVQNLLGNAELNAASANSGGNIQNSVKQAFKPLLKNGGAKVASWTDQEKAALNNIVRGTWTGTAARAAGNVLGGGGGLGMLIGAGAGYEEGGVPGAIAAGLAGRTFKKIGNMSTLKAVNKLDFLIRAKSPEALRIAAQSPQLAQALPTKSIQALRTLILADPTIREQAGQNVSQNPAYQAG